MFKMLFLSVFFILNTQSKIHLIITAFIINKNFITKHWIYISCVLHNQETACISDRIHYLANRFDVHVTVHHDKFLIIEPTRCTNFSKFYLEWKSTCFGQFLCPSSGVFHCTHSNTYRFADSLRTSCQQTCMTCTIAVCPVKNSWWWTKELSETCRVSFQIKFWDISASSWFYYKKMEKGLDCPQLKRCGRT